MEVEPGSPPSPPSINQSLCIGCQGFLIQPDQLAADVCRTTRKGRIILLSAEGGCPMCKVFVRHLRCRQDLADACWDTFVQPQSDYTPKEIRIEKSGEDSGEQFIVLKLLSGISNSGPDHTDLSTRLTSPGLPSSTDDRRCMAQASAWLEECLEKHTCCNHFSGNHTVETLPSRLLAVSSEKVAVITTAHIRDSNDLVYMTLSHKWRDQMPKLLQCNLKELELGVNALKLPKMFEDAFELARELQIPYVWIDALCIIQDDEPDKASEISKMGHIYRNAVLNIGATGASDATQRTTDSDLAPRSVVRCKAGTEMRRVSNVNCSTDVTNNWDAKDEARMSAERYDWSALRDLPMSPGLDSSGFVTEHLQPQGLSPGLFIDRDPLEFSPFVVLIKRKDEEHSYVVDDLSHTEVFQHSALFKRGWVLQERLLSPRTLFFDQKIVWECSELVACEMFPVCFPWKLPQPNNRIAKILTWSNEESRQNAQNQAWLDIVKEFTKCQLTYDSDCFPALSGLARSFQASLQDEYYAGLWKGKMIWGLCWRRDDLEFYKHPPFPDDYRAPSWSWASVKFPVNFIDQRYAYSYNADQDIVLGRVEDIHVTPSGSDPLGCILSARLQISGHLRKAVRRLSYRNTEGLPLWALNRSVVQCEWFDTGYEGENFDIRDISAAYFLLLAHQVNELMSHTDGLAVRTERLIGIIVEPVDEDRTKWRRIGAFDHPRGDDWMKLDYNPGYPEFHDWDPKNDERHTITII